MKNKLIIAGGIIATAIAAFVSFGVPAQANPSFFIQPVMSAAATSTTFQVVASTATSTITLDAYASGRPYAIDSATFLLQSQASSTASIVNISFQYSQDGIDWYDNNLITGTSTLSSVQIQTPNSYTWTALTTNRTLKAISVAVPTRYIRAVVSATASSSAIWDELVPKQESY